MLYFLNISKLAERKDKLGQPIPFSLKYIVKSTGEIRLVDNCVCTSSHNRPASINIQRPDGQIRKIRCSNILEFDNIEVYI